MFLAVDGEVHDDFVGRDVSSDDGDAGNLVRVGGCLQRRLSKSFVDLLDTTLERTCFPGCGEEKM